MLIPDKSDRKDIAQRLGEDINAVVREQLRRKCQEPSITSKVAKQTEDKLNEVIVGDYLIEVLAQDMPDRGRHSVEKKTGVDLFIGVRITNGGRTVGMKGLVIQAKNPGAHHTKDLDKQCETLTSETKSGAFVWIYDIGGTRVMSAPDILKNKGIPLTHIPAQSLYEHFEAFFECKEGDPELVSENLMNDPSIINDYLKTVYAKNAIAFDISKCAPKLEGGA